MEISSSGEQSTSYDWERRPNVEFERRFNVRRVLTWENGSGMDGLTLGDLKLSI